MGYPSTYRRVQGETLGDQPALDGLRALAVLAVLVFQVGRHVGGPDLAGGFLGVDVFFVLSGYLITTRLIEEWDKIGSIRLRNFYIRRVLRLMPALILTVALAAFVAEAVDSPFPRPYWQSAFATLAHVANWFQLTQTLAPLGHTWALSIAAQFLVVWPVILLLGLKMNGSKHRLAGITFALAICMAAARYITYEGGNAPLAALSTLLRPDGILIGSALALLLADPIRGLLDFLRRRDVALAAVALIAAAMCTFRGARPELYQGGLLFVNLATAVLVGHVALTRTSFIKRTMATQPLPAIGRISYGLYLFHVPVLYLVFNNPPTRNGIVAAGAMFALTFAIAGVSFLLIEAPILTLKKRFSSVTTLKERDERALVRSR